MNIFKHSKSLLEKVQSAKKDVHAKKKISAKINLVKV